MTHALTHLIVQHPKAMRILGIVAFVLLAGLAFWTWDGNRKLPDKPIQLTISSLSDELARSNRVWAEITDDVLIDCNSLVQSRSGSSDQTEVLMMNEQRNVFVLANYSGKRTCDEIKNAPSISGVFNKMSDDRVSYLRGQGLDFANYGNPSTSADLCTTCGKDKTQIYPLFLGGLALLSLLLIPYSFRVKPKAQ